MLSACYKFVPTPSFPVKQKYAGRRLPLIYNLTHHCRCSCSSAAAGAATTLTSRFHASRHLPSARSQARNQATAKLTRLPTNPQNLWVNRQNINQT